MKIIANVGTPQVATVYIADMGDGRLLEFVEALQPPFKRSERYILMVSTLFGCPVQCLICDAGGSYQGKPSAAEILMQIDYLVNLRFPDRCFPSQKFKIQFARMGEPSLNLAVLDALEQLPSRYRTPSLMPSISTIAPYGRDAFFERLVDIKDKYYPNGRFQFQYSLHTTDTVLRDRLIPVRKWNFERMAEYGGRFHSPGDRKITLNFALAQGMPVDAGVLSRFFNPDIFLIKITPINPTCQAVMNGLHSRIDPSAPESLAALGQTLTQAGYEVLISIGELEENLIGSNCGQYVLNFLHGHKKLKNGYTYDVEQFAVQ